MRKRRWIGLLAVIVLTLAACGGGDTTDTTEPSDTTTAPETTDGSDTTVASDTTAADGGAVSGDLSVVFAWTGSEQEAFGAVLAGFEEANPDVNLERIQIPFGEMNAQLTQQFAAGSGPDVTTALPGLIRLFADQGYLMPLDDMWSQWIADGAYTESLQAIASTGGTPYGVWFKGNVNALIWNTPERLTELGIEPPATWDDFTTALDTIQDAGDEPFAVGGADVWVPTQWWDPILGRVAGPEVFNGLVDGSVGWDDPAVAEAFEVFGQFIADYFPADALDRGFVEATCARVAGEAQLQNQGAFVNLVARGECDESLVPGEDYTYFLMPKYDESAPAIQNISGDLFAVNAATENPEAALALAEYLGSADAQAIWAARGGFVAPNIQVPVDVYPDANDQKAAELWMSAEVALYDLDDFIGGEIQTVLRESLQQFIRDQDVQAIVDAMVEVDERVRG
jgi:alpha-glucoside transport system substrate-binding protein